MGPMEGIRVLDLSKYGPSRYCSMILGDLGAEVIVVEYLPVEMVRATLFNRL